jgi:hypothetical protein
MSASDSLTMAAADIVGGAEAAVARGVEFLERRQLPSGELIVKWWRPAEPEWVHDPSIFGTALIAWSLDGVPGADGIRDRACDFIAAQKEPHGVWRHWTRHHAQFHYVPPDLDDTSVACLALRSRGRPVPDNRRLILANRAPDGRFYSWISLRPRWVANFAYWWISLVHLLLHPGKSIAFYHITPSERDDVDAVVNANTLFYLGRDRATEAVVPYLLETLEAGRESECDKWYDSPFVVLHFFSRALRRSGVDAGDLILGRLGASAPASALDLALSLCVQLDWDVVPSEDGIAALAGAQLESGGWPLAPFYKGRNVRWGSEELTTGFCLEALSRWLGREGR